MHTRQQTDPGMPPQSQALESMPVDTPRVGTKQGPDAAMAVAGVHHGREETTATAPAPTPLDVAVASSRNPMGDRDCRDTPAPQPRVFVLDKRKKPLDPTTPARAKKLLRKGRARVHRLEPFTIRLTDREREDSVVHDHVLAIDPGSKTTGIAVARVDETVNEETGEIATERTAVSLIELVHRGLLIKRKLEQRANYRRRRRSKNLRHRAPRFDNRTRPKGWLPPSLRHRVDPTMTWVRRLPKLVPASSIAVESVRFDTQALENPEITGTEYQQGTLAGYEVREYLLEKFDGTCVYCGVRDVPFNLDHVVPRARGGSNRVSNLAFACVPCNQAKGKHLLDDAPIVCQAASSHFLY